MLTSVGMQQSVTMHACKALCANSHGLGCGHVVRPVNDANAGQPKVCQLDMPLTGDEQVVWLQISMNDGLHRTKSSASMRTVPFLLLESENHFACRCRMVYCPLAATISDAMDDASMHASYSHQCQNTSLVSAETHRMGGLPCKLCPAFMQQ